MYALSHFSLAAVLEAGPVLWRAALRIDLVTLPVVAADSSLCRLAVLRTTGGVCSTDNTAELKQYNNDQQPSLITSSTQYYEYI